MKKRKNSFLVFLCCTLAVPTCGVLLGEVAPTQGLAEALLIQLIRPWLAVGVLLGIAHVILRPILRFLFAPIGCITLGLFGFVIDVALIYFCAGLVDGFAISGPLFAILTAALINGVCAVIS